MRTRISSVMGLTLYIDVNLDGSVYLRRKDTGAAVAQLSFDDLFDTDGNRFANDADDVGAL